MKTKRTIPSHLILTASAAALCASIVLLPARAQASPPQYTVTVLDDLGGDSFLFPYGINNSGQVVGTSSDPLTGVQAVRWTGTTPTGLAAPGGFLSSYGYGINDSGQVAGFAGGAVRWTGTTPTYLDNLGGRSYGYGINASGQVAGSSEINSNGGPFHAVRWTDTTPTDLGTLGGTESLGYGINDSGQVAGWSLTTDDVSGHAVRWTGTTPEDLGALPGGGGGYGYSINASGQVAGWADTSDGSGHAVRWTGTTPTDLGTLGESWSVAYGINAAGDVVGNYGDFNPQRPFLYTGGTMYDFMTPS